MEKQLKREVDFGAMHRDAMDTMAAMEQMLATVRRMADFAAHYMENYEEEEYEDEEEEDTHEDPMKDADKVIDDKNINLEGMMNDDSGKTNMVDRSNKDSRKKIAIIKLRRM
jgi:hypothetical protein